MKLPSRVTGWSVIVLLVGSLLAGNAGQSKAEYPPTVRAFSTPSTLSSEVPMFPEGTVWWPDPSVAPSLIPSVAPSLIPSVAPSLDSSAGPTPSPSARPSRGPSQPVPTRGTRTFVIILMVGVAALGVVVLIWLLYALGLGPFTTARAAGLIARRPAAPPDGSPYPTWPRNIPRPSGPPSTWPTAGSIAGPGDATVVGAFSGDVRILVDALRAVAASDVSQAMRQQVDRLLRRQDIDRATVVRACVRYRDQLVGRDEALRARLLEALEAVGVREVLADGEPFDADRHEAVETVATDDASLHDVVARTSRCGYQDRDHQLRPPAVVVYRREPR